MREDDLVIDEARWREEAIAYLTGNVPSAQTRNTRILQERISALCDLLIEVRQHPPQWETAYHARQQEATECRAERAALTSTATERDAQIRALTQILAYYAAHETWWLTQTDRGRVIAAEDDRGARARAALAAFAAVPAAPPAAPLAAGWTQDGEREWHRTIGDYRYMIGQSLLGWFSLGRMRPGRGTHHRRWIYDGTYEISRHDTFEEAALRAARGEAGDTTAHGE